MLVVDSQFLQNVISWRCCDNTSILIVLLTCVLIHCIEMQKLWYEPNLLNIVSVRARQMVKFKKLARIHPLTVSYQSEVKFRPILQCI